MVSQLKRSALPALLALVLVAGSAGIASAHMRGGRAGLGIPLHLLLRVADLTPAQRSQVHQLFATSRAQLKAERAQIRAARENIAARYASTGKVSASDFASDLAKIAHARAQIEQRQMQDALSIRALLTPAQLQKVAQAQATLEQIHAQFRKLMAQADAQAGPAAARPSRTE